MSKNQDQTSSFGPAKTGLKPLLPSLYQIYPALLSNAVKNHEGVFQLSWKPGSKGTTDHTFAGRIEEAAMGCHFYSFETDPNYIP